jgi:hypothetical protein
MSSVEDYSSWRLATAGGIRYRFLKSTGAYKYDTAQIKWQAVFRTVDLPALLAEVFPPPTIVNNIAYPTRTSIPGGNLAASDLDYESLDDDKPLDSLQFDSTAPGGTYSDYIKVTITYDTLNAKSPNPDDPRTFLEITSNTSADFIYVPPTGSKLQDEKNSRGSNDEEEGEVVEPGSNEVKGAVTADGEPRSVRTPALSSNILVPTTEWSIVWRQIPEEIFRRVIIHRCRVLMGRVNSTSVPILYNAYPETLLFAGFNYKESYTWRDGTAESPPIDLTMKVIEKRVLWRGVTCGHNHVWEPGIGWRRMLIGTDSNESPYRLFDFNTLTKV